MLDGEGSQLPYRAQATGFVELKIGQDDWRIYYLQSPRGQRLIAAGQRLDERDEVVMNFVASQLLPWLLVLPALLISMTWGLRRVLVPVRSLTEERKARSPDDLHHLRTAALPTDLLPLVSAMNAMFARIDSMLARERRFTADAAHELRTPLAVLRAQWDVLRAAADGAARREAETRMEQGLARMDRLVSQLLSVSRLEATQTLSDAERQEFAGIILAQSGSMARMLDELLDLARMEARRGRDFRRERVALAALIQELVRNYRAPSDRNPPQFRPPIDVAPVVGDADKLRQALLNVLSNAYKYSPEGGDVEISLMHETRKGVEMVGLRVADFGIGMEPHQLQRVFERFYRADRSGTVPGTGLGMSIVDEIIRLHQGEIEIDSTPRRGTRVTLWLPLAGAEVAPAA
jgi:two-component system sensor histidine kinase QseC